MVPSSVDPSPPGPAGGGSGEPRGEPERLEAELPGSEDSGDEAVLSSVGEDMVEDGERTGVEGVGDSRSGRF